MTATAHPGATRLPFRCSNHDRAHALLRYLVAGALAFAALLPSALSAQFHRVSLRGGLGLTNSFGNLDRFHPGTTWEWEARVRPTRLFSLGGGRRASRRQWLFDNIDVTGWFLEPRLHGPDLGGGQLAFALAVRATMSDVKLDRPTATTTSDGYQVEIGPVANLRLGSRFTVEAGLLAGWEDAGSAGYATPLDLGSGIGLAARAGLTLGIY